MLRSQNHCRVLHKAPVAKGESLPQCDRDQPRSPTPAQCSDRRRTTFAEGSGTSAGCPGLWPLHQSPDLTTGASTSPSQVCIPWQCFPHMSRTHTLWCVPCLRVFFTPYCLDSMASINANIHFGPLPSYTAVGSRCVAPKRYLIKQIKNNYIVTNNQLTLRMPCTFNVFCLMSIYTVASSLHSVSKKGIVFTSKCLFLCACIINSAWTEYHQSKKKPKTLSFSQSLKQYAKMALERNGYNSKVKSAISFHKSKNDTYA